MTDNLLAVNRRRSLWKAGDALCVAVSGGCDSVALLHALLTLQEQEGYALSAVHVNHHLRGAESDADAAFVEALCRGWKIPLTTFDVDVRGERRPGESEELCARRLRYRELDTLVEQGYRVVTAHTLSDQAETILFRLARGSGVKGLRGIPAKRGGYLRPLLTTTREETEAYCRENGLAFCHDSTNDCDAYTRNRLRHRVLPPLKEALPGCEEAIGRLSDQMEQLDGMLDRFADRLLSEARCADGLRRQPLAESERPVAARALQRFAEERTGLCPDAGHTEELLALIDRKGRLQLSGGWSAVCDDTLRLVPPDAERAPFCCPLEPGTMETPFVTLAVREDRTLPSVHNLLMFLCIDCDKIKGKAILRSRREGDRLRLPKRPDKPLRKWMNECRLPAEKRDAWPVVADDGGVIAVPGIGVDPRVAPDSESTKILTIEAEEKLCWNKM